MSRVLETVLTGRNLLSPMLASASQDVVKFNATVAGANEKAAVGATASARAQQAASTQMVTASGKASTAVTAGAGAQSAAADKIAASNVKASTSASASSQAQVRAHAKAAESATLSARVQETANRSLAASNGLLGTSLTPLTAGLGATGLALAYAGYRGMEFDSAMSQVQAASQASASTMNDLRDAAIEQGAKTKYSAEEAAQGITEMAKAGVSTADVMGGGLAGALNLAAAGQISVAEAAETGATALSVFRLEGNQMSHVADLLAAGAGKAQGSVGDMSAALNQSALVAKQTGLSIEDTAGALAMFASNGLIGSDAGTSFKTMLQALNPNSVAAAKAMDAIGFSAYDAQGNFVGLEDVAGQLRDGLSKLSVEQQNATLKTIFGSDAVRAAAILYNEGADGVQAWTSKVDDAGYAARQAGQNADNLKGDLEKLGGAVDSVATGLGDKMQDPLRELVQMLTGVITVGGDVLGFITSLPGPVLAGAAAFTALTMLRGPLDAMFTRLAVNLTSTVTGMGMATGATGGFTLATGAARAAIGSLITTAAPLAGVVLAAYAVKQVVDFTNAGDDATATVQDLGEAIKGAEGNQARFGAVSTGLDDLRKKAADAQAVIDEIDSKNFFSKVALSPFNGDTGDLRDAEKAVDAYNAAIEKMQGQNDRAEKSIDTLSERYHISRDEVLAFADAHGVDLTGALDETDWTFTRLAGSTGAFATQLGGLDVGAQTAYTSLAAYADALGLDEDATKELTKQTEELGQSLADFVTPLGAYTGLLDAKKTADQEAAQAQADATESSKDSWKDYVTDVTVTFDEYMAKLEEQVTAQANWQTNMLLLAGRVSQGTIDELARMGPEGAPLVADLVNRSDAELDRFDDITALRSKEATDAWGQQLTLAQPVLAAIGKTAGQGVVSELVAQLQAGTTTVADIATQYGLNLAGGINPVLSGLGKAPISLGDGRYRTSGGAIQEADGGVLDFYANGGVRENHVAQIAPSGAWRVWAEDETGGEAYIPLAPGKRDRSLDIWRETGKRLDAPEAQYYAFGGISDVPKPSSTAPYGMPISTAADATMQKGFDEVKAWLAANLEPPAASGGSSTGLLPIMADARQYVMDTYGVSNIGGFANRNIAGTNVKSDHAMGKAIDIMTSNLGLGWTIANDFAFGAAHDKFRAENVIWQQSISSNGGRFSGMADRGSPTQNHRDHVHVDTYDDGGLARGMGYLPKATVAPERVLSERQTEAFEQWMSSPASMPGYGTPASMPGYGMGAVTVSAPAVQVQVLIDGQEFKGMAKVVVDGRLEDLYREKVLR